MTAMIAVATLAAMQNAPASSSQSVGCDLVAQTLIAASAATRDTRIIVNGTCSEPGTIEIQFPGGRALVETVFDGRIDAERFAPLCGPGPQVVAVRYRAAGDDWRATLPILSEQTGEPIGDVLICDVILQSGLTPVHWEGGLSTVDEAVAPIELANGGTPRLITGAWLFDAVGQTWQGWAPDRPPSLQGFTLLVPGQIYWFRLQRDVDTINVRFMFPR